jgi:hypothetical protein
LSLCGVNIFPAIDSFSKLLFTCNIKLIIYRGESNAFHMIFLLVTNYQDDENDDGDDFIQDYDDDDDSDDYDDDDYGKNDDDNDNNDDKYDDSDE